MNCLNRKVAKDANFDRINMIYPPAPALRDKQKEAIRCAENNSG